jgi:ribosomal protein S27E
MGKKRRKFVKRTRLKRHCVDCRHVEITSVSERHSARGARCTRCGGNLVRHRDLPPLVKD